MEYLLLDYSKIQSKKNKKDYLVACCVASSGYRKNIINLFMSYNEFNEEFLKNNVGEYITSYVVYTLDKSNNIVPYIKY